MESFDELRSRAWCITINNYTEQEWSSCVGAEAEFSVFAPEIGENEETPHIQGYIYYKSAKKFKTMKKMFPRAHLEIPKGNPEQNKQYIVGPYKKGTKFKPLNENAVVRGECPVQGKRSDLDNVKEVLKETGSMRAVVVVASSVQSVRMAEMILKYHEPPRKQKPKISWFYGPSGSGKTRSAYEELGDDCYTCLSTGKWWEGYDGHENVLIDDYRKDFMPFADLLKLLDRYAFKVECKGGSRQFRGENIVITAPFHPVYYIPANEDKQQLLRRIDVIKEFGSELEIDVK